MNSLERISNHIKSGKLPSTSSLKVADSRHHRLLLLTHISPSSPIKEIEYIHTSLLPDPKNYHTWAYLHWLHTHFSSLNRISEEDWRKEQEWCDEMLKVDGRNNSAWGWRWFLKLGRPGAEGGEDEIE
jgi:protein farnesyltransferase/geranylgeranyltransferase type-1 subunit alpha